MGYYYRTTTGNPIEARLNLVEALGTTIDAGLIRAPHSDTWVVAGDGLPLPHEASITRFLVASSASGVISALTAAMTEGIAGVGYESPSDDGQDWERPVLAVRERRITDGGPRHATVSLSMYLAPHLQLLYRWTDGVDILTDDTGATLVFVEEV